LRLRVLTGSLEEMTDEQEVPETEWYCNSCPERLPSPDWFSALYDEGSAYIICPSCGKVNDNPGQI
jgi:rubrerythrin